MPRFLAAFALLAFALPASADDKPKPNTLTPKEIADGWILLFDGESTFGWKVEGHAEVKDGKLILGGEKATKLTTTAQFAVASYNFDYATIDGKPGKGGTYSTPGKEARELFVPGLAPSGFDTWAGFGANVERPLGPITIELPAGQQIFVKRFALKPAFFRPLFTGKNLDGWKVNMADPKRTASKWDVTKDGELSVKNGPGDLVSDKEFDNFVLQFECKTLGKALNSGFFFRCIPGQYQNGYEAQIQNAYVGDDRSKPADFGTGAIYRRVPARKVVSNDNEWFTMTVVADGKHIATWVNGYQTVDWTDDRKESDNPRQGYRSAKGPISIQGHDPTTDILFRNIRVAELPAAKK